MPPVEQPTAVVASGRPVWPAFPADGEWAQPASWRETLDVAIGGECNIRALGALRKVFPPAWAMRDNELADKHPLAIEHRSRLNRFELVEIGRGIDELKPSRLFRKNLRRPSTFHQAASELWAGQLLRASGATIEHEPCRGRGRGPDWFASWRARRTLAVEVKTPRLSEVDRALEIASSRLFVEASAGLNAIPRVAECLRAEIRLSIEVEKALVLLATRREPRLLEVASKLGEELASRVRRSASGHLDVGTYALGRLGEIEVGPSAGSSGVCLGGRGIGADEQHGLLRLSALIFGASDQLEAFPGPGIVLIDARDLFVFGDLRRALEARLPSLGAVGTVPPAAVLLKWSAGNPSASVPYSGVHVLRGPDFESIPDQFWSAFVRCPMGHYHFEPLKDPAERYLCASAEVEWL